MELATIAALNRRLERLERECRRWRRLGAVALLGFGGVLMIGAARPSVVASGATGLHINDREGRQRLVLSTSPRGDTGLTVRGTDPKAGFAFRAGPDGLPGLSMRGLDNKAQLRLGFRPDGTPVVSLKDMG